MLAYVFWHWPRPGVTAADYEARQRAFHSALAAEPPPGFERSYSFALAGAPWANRGQAAYEDWYLVGDSAALDPLNTGAVSAGRRGPHDAAAALAADGIAGLYVPRLGRPLPSAQHARWFGKPLGMSYARLDDLLAPRLKRHGAVLWMRFMVLGPSPEFCVQSAGPLELPEELHGSELELRPL